MDALQDQGRPGQRSAAIDPAQTEQRGAAQKLFLVVHQDARQDGKPARPERGGKIGNDPRDGAGAYIDQDEVEGSPVAGGCRIGADEPDTALKIIVTQVGARHAKRHLVVIDGDDAACPELAGRHRQDAAAGPQVGDIRPRPEMFLEKPQAQSRRSMFSGPEGLAEPHPNQAPATS